MKFVGTNKQKNNCGMALVSVLIVITLIGLLASSILNLSYLAYQRKLVEKKDTENFYANEAVIDTIKSVIQNAAVTALGEVDDTDDFAAAAKKDIEQAVANESGVSTLTDYLFKYVVSTMGSDVEKAITSINDGGNGGSFSVGEMEIVGDALYIRNVVVEYVNDEGYSSRISTDIVINAPTYASDANVPLGTYSMFAGSGASVTSSAGLNTGHDLNNMRYNAQQGNVYFGSQTSDTSVSLTLGTESDISMGMASVFSVGGTNAVFNGNVILYPGSTLIFTGGDGSEACNIQVNGYIILGAGATLLLPSNVNLVCKGILVYTYDSNGNVTGTTSYSYTDEATVSEFYPVLKSAVSSSTVYTSEYLNNKADVADVLYETGMLKDDSSIIDDRFVDIYDGRKKSADEMYSNYTTTTAGVYMLDTSYTLGTGWSRSVSDQYYALSCSGGVWSCGKSGLYSGNITCNATDTKLDQEKLVLYNGSYYDAEFWNFINVPVLCITSQDAKVGYCLSNYVSSSNASTTNTTYTKVNFSDLSTKYSSYSNILNILWNNKTSGDNGYDISTRKLIVPNDSATTEAITWSNYSVTYDGVTYTPSADRTQISSVAQPVNVGSDALAFCVNISSFNVQLNSGYYVGLFMSAGKVEFTAGSGVTIGTSILEMAKKLTTNGLSDSDNKLRVYLEKLATGVTATSFSSVQLYSNGPYAYEFLLVDNIFNGGISSLWTTTSSGGSSSTPSSVDNSSTNFVDTENWSRD